MPLFDVFLTKGFKDEAQDREEAKDMVLNEETNLDVRSVDIVAEKVEMEKFDRIVNYKDFRESLELILSESRLTDYELDEVLESLDDAVANNTDELTLEEKKK